MSVSRHKQLARFLHAILDRVRENQFVDEIDFNELAAILPADELRSEREGHAVLRFLFAEAWERYEPIPRAPDDQRDMQKLVEVVTRNNSRIRDIRSQQMKTVEQLAPRSPIIRSAVLQLQGNLPRLPDLQDELERLRPGLNSWKLHQVPRLSSLFEKLYDSFRNSPFTAVVAALRNVADANRPLDAEVELNDSLALAQHFNARHEDPYKSLLLMLLLDLAHGRGRGKTHADSLLQKATSDSDQLARTLCLLASAREITDYVDIAQNVWHSERIAKTFCDLFSEGEFYDQLFHALLKRGLNEPVKPVAFYWVLGTFVYQECRILEGTELQQSLRRIPAKELSLASCVGFLRDNDSIDEWSLFTACWEHLLWRSSSQPLSSVGRAATIVNLHILGGLGGGWSRLNERQVSRLFQRARESLASSKDRHALSEAVRLLYENRADSLHLKKLSATNQRCLLKLFSTTENYTHRRKGQRRREYGATTLGFPERIRENHLHAREVIGAVWDCLSNLTRKFLVRGMWHYRCEESMEGEECEFSSAFQSYANAIRSEVKHTLERQLKAASAGRDFLKRLNLADLDWGNFIHLLKSLKDSPRDTRWLAKATSVNIDLLVSICPELERLRREGRNPAAHAVGVDREGAAVLHDLLFNKHLLRRTFEALHASPQQ